MLLIWENTRSTTCSTTSGCLHDCISLQIQITIKRRKEEEKEKENNKTSKKSNHYSLIRLANSINFLGSENFSKHKLMIVFTCSSTASFSLAVPLEDMLSNYFFFVSLSSSALALSSIHLFIDSLFLRRDCRYHSLHDIQIQLIISLLHQWR